MVAWRTNDDAETSASISQLVASIKDDLTGLVRDEVALAKAEVRDEIKAATLGGVFIALGIALSMFALLLLSFALVYGVSALGVTLGWSFLIVGGGYLVIAALLALLAKGRFGKVKGTPRAKAHAKGAVAALTPTREGASRP